MALKLRDAANWASGSKLRARLNDTREAMRQRAEVTISDAQEYVRENPWQTIAIVSGVALMAGTLFASRLR
ncbi:glycine zipper domain-containing protein [Paraburkholderia elongata]|nr:hypothetical protein [Paraburkholderia elongata]